MICRLCNGTGIDQQLTGDQMREHREAAEVSMRSVAKRMGVSPTYLSDLENGRRHWTVELMTRFMLAVRSER